MKIAYDREADALSVTFRSVKVDHTREVEEGVLIDFDADNHIVGVEVLDASHRMSPEELARAELLGIAS